MCTNNNNDLGDANDLFVGRIPPFLFFEMQCHSLSYLVETHQNDPFYKDQNPAVEISTIGLVAHFEAFCKHHFAALINLSPKLLKEFCKRRDEPKIEISTLLSYKEKFESNLGFILSEQYDFGSSKRINGLFRDLLMISPFSSDESIIFDDILQKRNLLVHHAGFYTLQHLKKNRLSEIIKDSAYRKAIKLTVEDYREIWDFLFGMAMKLIRSTVPPLKKHLETERQLNSLETSAIEGLYQGVYDTLEE